MTNLKDNNFVSGGHDGFKLCCRCVFYQQDKHYTMHGWCNNIKNLTEFGTPSVSFNGTCDLFIQPNIYTDYDN